MTLSENECDEKTCAKKDWKNLKLKNMWENMKNVDFIFQLFST